MASRVEQYMSQPSLAGLMKTWKTKINPVGSQKLKLCTGKMRKNLLDTLAS
jgi:hypothetical protein